MKISPLKTMYLLLYINGRKYTLKEDVIGASNKKKYASAGDKVVLESVSEPACVVRDINGILFPTNIYNLK